MNKKEKSARAKPIADGAEKFLGRRREILRTRRRNSLNGSGKSFEYVRNPYGLRIKVCCASCHWKQLTESLVTRKCRRLKKRKCRRLKKRVKPRHCCGFWGMSDGLRTLNIKH